jgi:hypothetical protein
LIKKVISRTPYWALFLVTSSALACAGLTPAKTKKECPTVGRFVILVARLLFVSLKERFWNKTPYWALSRDLCSALRPDNPCTLSASASCAVLDLAEFRRANGSLTTATHET